MKPFLRFFTYPDVILSETCASSPCLITLQLTRLLNLKSFNRETAIKKKTINRTHFSTISHALVEILEKGLFGNRE